jgi:hypothetical protein
MLERILEQGVRLKNSWSDLGNGAPTVIALAEICSRAMVDNVLSTDHLSAEALAILHAARERGVIEVKGSNTAYESAARFLTVIVEIDDEQRLRFRNNTDPKLNVRFFDGFRELCAGGLVMHHLYHEFSLTRAGFDFAATIDAEEVQSLLDEAQMCAPGT